MKEFFLPYFICLFLLLIIDGIWLNFIIKNFVHEHIGHLMSESIRIAPVVAFYPLYAFGIIVFVILPAIEGNFEPWRVFFLGGLLGLVAYGAYDLTNFATLKGWTLHMTLTDMAWGATLTGLVSTITFYLTRAIQ